MDSLIPLIVEIAMLPFTSGSILVLLPCLFSFTFGIFALVVFLIRRF